jgi:phospholipase/carboxylesterase
VRSVTVNGGMPMRAWYDIKSLGRGTAVDPTADEDLAGFWDADARVRALIAREGEAGIPADRIVVGGFSQGGAVSLYSAPRYPERLAGVLALSCYLPLAGRLSTERHLANQTTPIFMAHGDGDQVLPISLGSSSRDWLREQGFTVDWHAYPMAHSVCPAEVADIRAFLLRVLPPL